MKEIKPMVRSNAYIDDNYNDHMNASITTFHKYFTIVQPYAANISKLLFFFNQNVFYGIRGFVTGLTGVDN